jgi:DNA-binding transcriptional regulator YdaS (Cro superfamily)
MAYTSKTCTIIATAHTLGFSPKYIADWCNEFKKTPTDIEINIDKYGKGFVTAAMLGEPQNLAYLECFGVAT